MGRHKDIAEIAVAVLRIEQVDYDHLVASVSQAANEITDNLRMYEWRLPEGVRGVKATLTVCRLEANGVVASAIGRPSGPTGSAGHVVAEQEDEKSNEDA